MNIEAKEILRCLPHRYPLLLVDRIIEVEEGVRGVGIKNVTINESYFEGHFPGDPIMPGVLIIECMAQTAATIFSYRQGERHHEESSHRPKYLAMINNMKFRKKVVPGDRLIIEVKLIKRFGRLIQVFAEAQVQDEVVASGKLTFAG